MSALPRWGIGALLLVIVGQVPVEPAHAQPSPAAAGASTRDTAALQREVDALADWVAGRGGRVSLVIREVRSGRTLAAAHPTLALNPASNAKVVTAAVALARLGPSFRYTTGVYGAIREGVARELVLRGHGDPSLEMAEIAELARVLVDMGLARVDGSILVDQSRFDEQYVPPAFDQQPNEWASFRAPVSAVALERNTVTLNVLPTESGKAARAWYSPPGCVDSTGEIETRKVGAGQAVTWSLTPDGPRLRGALGGHVAEGLPRLRFTRRVDDPSLLAGYALRHELLALGVKIKGGVAAGGIGERRRLAHVESAPLATLLNELGKESDNFYAEMVFKSLGDPGDDKPATSAGAAAVVLDWLAAAGARRDDTRVTNGSGLFDANRLSAETLVEVLRAAYQDPAIGPEFVTQLAIGGVDGTLRSRFRGLRDGRRIRAKTGTLAKADALSGYVLAPAGKDPIAFSIVINDVTAHQASRARIDRVVAALAAEP